LDRWDILAAEAMPSDAEEEAGRSSWWAKDLGPILDGTWKPPEPTVGRRSDGRGIFYRGKSHAVVGESEAGKGWAALGVVRQEIEAGHHVIYLDFEDDEGSVTGRLLTLAASPATITKRFHYIRPEAPLQHSRGRADLDEMLAEFSPTLAVVDGITEGMSLHDLNPLDNVDIARFNGLMIKPLTESGAAEVSLDHVIKAQDGRGRYALGGAHKLNVVTIASYILENRQPFGVGMTGRSTLAIAKDRPGQLRIHGVRSSGGLIWYGDFELTSVVTDARQNMVDASIKPPEKRDDSWRPTIYMARVSDFLKKHGGQTQNAILAGVPGKTDKKREALELLILDGYVARPESRGKPYEPIKHYVPEET
jgi:hypothetical protein